VLFGSVGGPATYKIGTAGMALVLGYVVNSGEGLVFFRGVAET